MRLTMGDLSGLGEYSSLRYCLSEIPQKVRRGLSIVDVHFTCLDVVEEFIVVGTNIGVIYWCNRKTNQLERLRPQKYGPAITTVKVVSTVDYMVAAGDCDGAVSIFVVPKAKPVFLPADHRNVKRGIERFTAADLHLSPITAMVWSTNGQKLFTGDEKGIVAYTEMDFKLNIIKSMEILNEKFSIVQLSYRPQMLVVASEYRCIIYHQNPSQSKQQIYQVGQKERRSLQKLGAFVRSRPSRPGLVVFSARPKQRIWEADAEGNVNRTLLFKEPLTQNYPEIRILRSVARTELRSQDSAQNNSTSTSADSLSSANDCDIAFTFFHEYKNKYLLVHDDHSLVLLNPETTTVEAGFTTKRILSVAVNGDEIFVLEGCRRVRRISFSTDPYCATEFDPYRSDMPIGDKLLGMVQETSTNLVQSVIENFKKMENVVNSYPVYDTVIEDISPAEEALHLCYPEEQQPREYNTQHLRISYDIDTSCDDIVHNRQRKVPKAVPHSPKSLQNDSGSVSGSPEILNNRNHSIQNDEQAKVNEHVEREPSELLKLAPFGEVPNDIKPDLRPPTSILHDVERNEFILALLLERQSTQELPTPTDLETLPDIKDAGPSHTDESLSPEIVDAGDGFLESAKTEMEPEEVEITCAEETVEEQVLDNYSTNTSNDIAEEFAAGSSDINLALVHSHCEKYWKRLNVPAPVKWICVTRSDVFCGGAKQSVYQSSCRTCPLQWVKQKCRASRMVISHSGNIVWKIDLGVLYALKDADNPNPWQLVARNVQSAAANDWSVWYISGGAIFVQIGLSRERTYSESTKLKCFSDPLKICCFENNVWLLSTNGIILNRELVSAEKPLGESWKVVPHPDTISIVDISLGARGTGWLVDKFNNVYFTDDFSGDDAKWWQVMIDRNIHKSDSALFRSKEKPVSTVASGFDSVWITTSNEDVILVNKTAVLGHNWSEIPVSTSIMYKTRWKLLAAAGETEHTASVWCLSSSNDLFLCLPQRNCVRSVEMPTTNEVVSISAVPDMIWLLTHKNEIFVRRGISELTPFGWTWEQLVVHEVESSISSFKHLSIGRDVIWALSTDGRIYAAVADLYAITSATFALDWILLHDSLLAESKFVDVVVGPNKYMVWALDDKHNVYTRQSIFDEFPFGTKWISVPGIKAVYLTVSPSAVWALSVEGYVYRRSNVTAEDPIGEQWTQVPGYLSLLTASVFESLWGVSKQTGRLLKYENNLLALKAGFMRERTFSERIEDEWEMVEEASIYQIDD